MSEAVLEQRMTGLEDLMAELLRAQARTQQQVEQTSREYGSVCRTTTESRQSAAN